MRDKGYQINRTAGGLLPPRIAAEARLWTGAAIYNLYGSTEAGTVAMRRADGADPSDAGSITPGSLLEVVGEDDRPLPAGVEGAIRYRRPYQADSYLGQPEASAIAFRDGWFYPGDRSALGPEGRLVVAGRTSELINAGGVKIDPALIDLAASEIAGITDAASCGVADASGLVVIALAYVPGKRFDPRVASARLAERLGPATPSLLVQVGVIPRNLADKIQRHALAELVTGAVAGA